MPMFRKKPVVIEARQITWYQDLEPIAKWVNTNGGKMVCGQDDSGPAYGNILTLEGVHRADILDFVIQGVKGEFYPCKPDIFAMTYDAVED
jgi:hypothetical protein